MSDDNPAKLKGHKACSACGGIFPLHRFSPRAYSPDGVVIRYMSHCKSCSKARQAWDREYRKRVSYLQRHGMGTGAYEDHPDAAADQRLPEVAPGPAQKPMPVMPEAYFSAEAKSVRRARRVLTPEEEAKRVKANEKRRATAVNQQALNARLKRDGVEMDIAWLKDRIALLENALATNGDFVIRMKDGRKTPWKLHHCGSQTPDEVIASYRERLETREAELASMVLPEEAPQTTD